MGNSRVNARGSIQSPVHSSVDPTEKSILKVGDEADAREPDDGREDKSAEGRLIDEVQWML